MCATLPTATRSGKCESLITLNLDELHEIMNVVQMFVDERCIFRTQFERFLKKVVRTRDILPPYLFIPGVQKIGTNAVGGGGFADVWRGELEGKPVALKVLRIFGPQTECAKIFKEFSKEAMIWRQFDHPNILPFHGCCRDLFTPLYAFISPWMENGDMVSFLKQNPNADRLAMVRGVASGLCYLHNLRPQVIHGDLRGVSSKTTQLHFAYYIRKSNVLIDENKLPRIADFGLATVADTQAISLATVSYNGKGSLRWQAPELLSFSKEATESVKTTDGSDVYAFACLCLEVFTDRPPFSGLSDGTVIAALLIHDERPARPLAPAAERGLDDEMWDLMQNCWATRRSERPRMKAVYERIRPYTPSEDRRDDREPFTSQATSDRRRVFDLPEECFKPEIQRYRLGVKPSDLS
ncbi:kinase-like protein [Rickenella mellea]|uniref:Kinase-like protein n=1 Tax=Rickenella mellea TaxID=50990 RepID=A0A4Y7Q8U4_9AGAM|nr:kinase-like protein [Rickenella mellea]